VTPYAADGFEYEHAGSQSDLDAARLLLVSLPVLLPEAVTGVPAKPKSI
jgi:hypothetical protein